MASESVRAASRPSISLGFMDEGRNLSMISTSAMPAKNARYTMAWAAMSGCVSAIHSMPSGRICTNESSSIAPAANARATASTSRSSVRRCMASRPPTEVARPASRETMRARIMVSSG